MKFNLQEKKYFCGVPTTLSDVTYSTVTRNVFCCENEESIYVTVELITPSVQSEIARSMLCIDEYETVF